MPETNYATKVDLLFQLYLGGKFQPNNNNLNFKIKRDGSIFKAVFNSS